MDSTQLALLQAPVSGFLADTPVLTTAGYRPISSLVTGDKIISPDGNTDTVIEVKSMKRIACAETTPYVIPKGLFGAKKDIYLSPSQRIVIGRLREVRGIGRPVIQHSLEDATPINYYNIRLESRAENSILVAGIAAEPLPANERMEVSIEEFHTIIRDRYGSRPEDETIKAIFKVCKKLPSGMMEIPMFLFDSVPRDD